ncbi:MAG: efflux RND transporter periplasmic adaptor subunit [Acidobacteriaceae bacterium]
MSNTENDRNRAAPDAANASSPETDSQRLSLEPTRHTIRRTVTILIVLLIVFVVIAITGIIPRQHARAALRKETDSMAVPTVSVIQPKSGAPMQEIILPGTIQAYQDAPIYARTNGYLKSWSHDIGSHVRKGELLAVIESPEIDRQVDQARAAVATAKANLGLARVTARRYEGLRGTEAVSKQSIDTATQTESAQTASLAVAQQTLNQMLAMQSFERVYAPFSGIVTARNTDIGQLVDSGSNGGTGSPATYVGSATNTNASTPQELFRVSNMHIVRIFIQVPGMYVPEARPGVVTDIDVSSYPGQIFHGKIVRTANSLDLTTRTMTVEVDIDNRNGQLLPGAYAQVHLKLPMKHPALIIPVSTLMFRSEGLRIVTLDSQDHAHLQPITVGRDWGTRIEVLTGLHPGQRIVESPPDSIVDNEKVKVVSGKNMSIGVGGAL